MRLSGAPYPTEQDVAEIRALSDLVLRNLLVTQGYHELALGLRKMLGPMVNWSAFATYASRQAGETIRAEDLDQVLRPTLETLPRPLWGPLLEAFNRSPLIQHASQAVSRGNIKVFEEIGAEFSHFITCLGEDESYNPRHIAEFKERLRPGDPPDGQDYLRSAFTSYYRARFTPDMKRRQEFILFANACVGVHEQTRLQPEIEAAFSVPLPDMAAWEASLVQRFTGPLEALFGSGASDKLAALLPIDTHGARLAAWLHARAQQALTQSMMRFTLPSGQRLRLSENVPGEFPTLLQRVDRGELRALLAKVDRTPDSTAGSGARSWVNIYDRMNFIVDLFRTYQKDQTLFDPPFPEEQVRQIKAGL